jgi:anti-anti-sigma factor
MPDPAAKPAETAPESGPGPELTGYPTVDDSPPPEPIPACQLGYEVVNGVLVITVPQGELDDELTVGPFRHNLHTLLDHPVPRRVVLDLENIHYLSSRAVGVILAYFQRLDREGGALRVACVSPKKLIDLYASVEEAVSDPWI